MIVNILAVLVGVVLLAFAADQFVIGGASLSRALRVPPIVVGVVVMGFGTSAPEMIVSSIAAADGHLDLAVGNIVGSNLANLSLLLGVGAIITTITVSSDTVRREGPIALVAAVTFWVLVQGDAAVWKGLVLLGGLALALGRTLYAGVRGNAEDQLGVDLDEFVGPAPRVPVEVARTLAGLIGTLVGAQTLLFGATNIAEDAGLSEGFVGVSLVAFGTSLPELVTVVQSARRREVDLIVGNLLGSNLFNVLAVGGLAMLFGSGPVADTSLTLTGMALVTFVTALAGIFMWTGRQISRGEGAALIVVYVVCLVLLRI
ncbi:MAG: calcium/sodium antiporter [Acidimicrobiia bacterium]